MTANLFNAYEKRCTEKVCPWSPYWELMRQKVSAEMQRWWLCVLTSRHRLHFRKLMVSFWNSHATDNLAYSHSLPKYPSFLPSVRWWAEQETDQHFLFTCGWNRQMVVEDLNSQVQARRKGVDSNCLTSESTGEWPLKAFLWSFTTERQTSMQNDSTVKQTK